ncbi:MAG: DUF2911 domain-containing protein [Ignavibacteria bacterium]|nr:DUF2911 domain-containing protein [Ignavibacteria bacterium]MBK6420339.1 DUF2911 domain-containing protein [Ignavibacteria bacterium]MBP7093626.1 DUF2911 domain-containing protein [Candidatus Kapabacteria bacterium]
MIKLIVMFGVAALLSASVSAQINVPVAVSQRGTTSQRIGVTDISIDYGRPAVNKRVIWGDLVPYNTLWRAGANENTVFTASTPVKIEGKDLPAGRYGLHMIPSKTECIIIFSKDSHAWGSYFYNKENDALRVTVKPTSGPRSELLTFDVPSMTESSATFQLRWDSVAIPFVVSVDLGTTVANDLKAQLTGIPGFTAQNYATAAAWLVQHDTQMPLAEEWIQRTLKTRPTFTALMLAARLDEKKGDRTTASERRKKAMEIGTNTELNSYGYELLQSGQHQDAVMVFEVNAKRFPSDPNVWDSLGEAYAMNKESKKAIECFNKSLSMNPSADVRKNSEMWLEKLR